MESSNAGHSSSKDDAATQSTARLPSGSGSPSDQSDTQQWIMERVRERVRERLRIGTPTAERIGRYVVLELIGQGGMGMVYAAYDEQLDRKVALKVLLDEELSGPQERLRFVREAQALARLSHPHVVTVHEVDESDGRIYLAMEYIRGMSLAAWLETEPEWPQVLEAFLEAGQGLAAAHAEGLVHRDFKPANAMRTEQGRVKVLDFGLARVAANVGSTETITNTGSHSVLTTELTQAGTIMGTPAYMAPEQLETEALDARSDQYAFCVALWEGLAGTRPFPKTTLKQILELKLQGAPPWPDDVPPVPSPIVDALRRGLEADPEDRWPSMDELLLALAWEPRRSGRRWLGLAALAGLGGIGVALAASSGAQTQPCQGARQQLEETWNDTRRNEVETSVLGIDRSFAQNVSIRTLEGLDTYADGWVKMHTEACEATAVLAEQSSRMLDLRMACLDRALDELDATVSTLANADAGVASRAHELLASLPPISRCANTEALEAEVEPPLPAETEAVTDGRQQLARAKSLRIAGRYEDALDTVEDASRTLENIAYAPVHVELTLERGQVLDALGLHDDAAPVYEEASRLALRSGQRRAATIAASRLMAVVGVRQRRPDAALLLRSIVLGTSEGDPLLEVQARNAIGRALLSDGRFEESEHEHRAALALVEPILPPEHPTVVETRNDIANVLRRLGRYAEAEAEHRTAMALRETWLGPDHPSVAIIRRSLASDLERQDKHAEAEAELRSAATTIESALGTEHQQAMAIRNNLGYFLIRQHRLAEAEAELRAVVELRVKVSGPEHPDTSGAQINLSIALAGQGKLEEAEPFLRAGLRTLQQTLGPTHRETIMARSNLGALLHDQGKIEQAEAELRRSLEAGEASMGPDTAEVVRFRGALIKLLLESGRPAEALPLAEQSWRAIQAPDTMPELRTWTARSLASALWDVEGAERDRVRARALVKDALQALEGPDDEHQIRVTEKWLEDHPAP